jgi:hypothetical protein
MLEMRLEAGASTRRPGLAPPFRLSGLLSHQKVVAAARPACVPRGPSSALWIGCHDKNGRSAPQFVGFTIATL